MHFVHGLKACTEEGNAVNRQERDRGTARKFSIQPSLTVRKKVAGLEESGCPRGLSDGRLPQRIMYMS